MRLSLALIIVALMAGCGKPSVKPPTEAEVYAQLWIKCQNMHLKYQVTCQTSCDAYAWDADVDFYTAAHHRWMWQEEGNGPTDSARILLRALDGPRDSRPLYSPEINFNTGQVDPTQPK